MKIENQVCSLEQAKRLGELSIGIHTSTFCYCYFNSPAGDDTKVHLVYSDDNSLPAEAFVRICDAFTVAELGVMNGNFVDAEDSLHPFMKSRYGVGDSSEDNFDSAFEKFMAELFNPLFLADLLIWRIENNLTTAAEVNERLKAP